ncbi:P-loop containing nucleoside triphosphate hydrolase [Arabidopsis thaliana x Arabidopsis arenosa]|uniref:P-loop containing nucleoside triphosphate hydrolase n=1 Tax=Arabidopsis thaliana x Arabidopsis arenosa TaxID=1240361 RepID=A0A8T1XKU9_9BRAS|nr:P-loop containing nucleoside triphosphate hydrolase [Arabidopsis thaliana x Arabidopsis arenosa]
MLGKSKGKAEVESAGGLDANVKESGCSFSVGQRQLASVPPLLPLFSSHQKILCLDECTADINVHTTSLLHNTKGMQSCNYHYHCSPHFNNS